MRLVKSFIKKVIKFLIKIRIVLHHSKSLDSDETQCLSELNKLNPITKYDLTNAVKKINKYNYNLSLIVPVYNASKYLQQCIDSLLNQKTSYSYEVICIDDGSTDDSLTILNKYHSSKLKVIHQNNQGISCARNKGLNLSTGEYIGFVDNDDYVDDNYVEKLLKNAYGNGADYVRNGYLIFDENSKKIIDNVSSPNYVCRNLNSEEELKKFGSHGYMWAGVYRRNIWEGFCFPNGYWFEDMVKGIYIYSKCSVVSNVSDILYFKRKHLLNAADTLWKKENIKCLDQLYLACELIDLTKQHNLLNENAVLNELGEYLYKRTFDLPNEVRKDAFIIACKKYKELNTNIKVNDKVLLKVQKALLNKDYELWCLTCAYKRYSS